MRTIKFRGKTIFDDKWVYGDLHILSKYPHIHLSPFEKETIDTSTIGQFTGLTDKYGKEIYEGDIVRFKHQVENIGVVIWDDINPCMCIEYHDPRFKTSTNWEYDFVKCGCMEIEVIGNIHDNPELMEGGKR